MTRPWNGRVRPIAGLAATTLTILTLFAGAGPALALQTTTGHSDTSTTTSDHSDGTRGSSDHSDGTAGTEGSSEEPQPESTADQNSGGANGDCPDGPYCSTRDGSASENGSPDGEAKGKPCAGCVGKADNKNPKGQYPNGSDDNAGYECDRNQGIGQGNPAHTGCQQSAATSSCQTEGSASGEQSDSSDESTSSDQSTSGDHAGSTEKSSDESTGDKSASRHHADSSDDKSASDDHADSGDDESTSDDRAESTDESKASDESTGDESTSGDESASAGGDCPPCPADQSMSDTDQECSGAGALRLARTTGTTVAGTSANRPAAVLGVEAYRTPAQAKDGRSAVAAAAAALLPDALLPNTGAGAAMLLLLLAGAAMLLIGTFVLIVRRRTARI